MNTVEGSWEEFEAWVSKLRDEIVPKSTSPLLFRGHADSEWPLTTTLERNSQESWSFAGYYNLITVKIGPAVETFTGVKVPEYGYEFKKSFNDSDLFFPGPNSFPSVPLYQYMVYLRHHGFPSPLLDWSYSPYVAAFFAFRDDHQNRSRMRSIYAYCERPNGTKGGILSEPWIRPIGPYVRSHRRHFRQQSDYTICGRLDIQNGWSFGSHQRVFDHARPNQDFLWRFDIPSEERVKVLHLLDEYNLNAFSLFDTEETLLESMWLRERVFDSGRIVR